MKKLNPWASMDEAAIALFTASIMEYPVRPPTADELEALAVATLYEPGNDGAELEPIKLTPSKGLVEVTKSIDAMLASKWNTDIQED